MKLISPDYAHNLSPSSTVIVDVSTTAEYSASHIAGSINYPLGRISKDLKSGRIKLPQKSEMILSCQSGQRAQLAFKQLVTAGFEVAVIDGGNQAWNKAGLAMIWGKGTISLERQVRIAAGGIGLTGSILSYFVSPEFILIPTIIGAGLLNAGLTNWCGMGLLLAKMPWNNSTDAASETAHT